MHTKSPHSHAGLWIALIVGGGAAALVGLRGCSGTVNNSDGGVKDTGVPDGTVILCPNGIDKDNDGYGTGCALGDDCNDNDPSINPGAKEFCDGKDNNCNNQTDEGVTNKCGTCDPGCAKIGEGPFEIDKTKDPNLKDANGVGLDGNGDLVLDKSKVNFNYMWIANALDTNGAAGGCTWATETTFNPALNAYCRGTVSKIDTVTMKEVARYFTQTCKSKAGTTGCVDLHGLAIAKDFPNAPSRTAVDYNFDVWVANRAFGGQASASKIANELVDCVDRNSNGVIDTSKDLNGDGKITVDCNGDGVPDSASTVCSGAFAGSKPEFLGDDDECILFTVNYGGSNDMGRSICLDGGIDAGASNAWVGTFNHSPNNRFYKIDGTTGALAGPYELPAGHSVYGCVVDSQHILWGVDFAGTMSFLNTLNPTQIGALIAPPWTPKGFYGVAIDGNDHIWAGGWSSGRVYRYKPDRKSFATLGAGVWTGVTQPTAFDYSRGIAPDKRGKVWVAINGGYIWRVEQSLGDGLQDQSTSTSYWPTKGTGVTGVGVDFAGHVWAIAYNSSNASRLDVNATGDPIQPPTAATKAVDTGLQPYTYSDFTGYGLQNFTRPQGRYLYQMQPCNGAVKPTWKRVSWTATTPTGTSVQVRVRSGDSDTTLGQWFGPYQQSPAMLKTGTAAPLDPNPAWIIQVEFTLKTTVKSATPILHDFDVAYDCADIPQ
jgi:hypothetical protein